MKSKQKKQPQKPANLPSDNRATRMAWPSWIPWLMGGLAVIQILVLKTVPLKDGDLYWQMAYGRFALDNHTLIADHSAYTWSRTGGNLIYCAWFAQIFLYLCYKIGGMGMLFALRYGACFVFLGATMHVAKLAGVLRHPFTWVACFIAMGFSNHSGPVLKPELFSFLGMIAVAYVWARLRLKAEKDTLLPYFFPLIMLLWVNCHGGFIFGMVFIGLLLVGEEMNTLFNGRDALTLKTRRHLFIAVALSGVAMALNPYGVAYPIQVLRNLVGADMEYFRTIADYQPAFSRLGTVLHLPAYLVGSILLFVTLIGPKIFQKRWNWSILLPVLFFAFLYSHILRATYFLAPIFAMSCVLLLKEKPAIFWPSQTWAKNVITCVPAGVSILITATLYTDYTTRPVNNRWFGFGTAYSNSIEEADFIAENLTDYKIGNDYDSGSYLLWRLYPDTKIMIDARQFPFKEWYAEYFNALRGKETKAFIDKTGCDVFCINFMHSQAIKYFSNSPDWKLLFYGAGGAVYGKTGIDFPVEGVVHGKKIDDMRVKSRAKGLLVFAVNQDDWEEGALRIYNHLRDKHYDEKTFAQIRRIIHGMLYYRGGEFEKAAKLLDTPEDAQFKSSGLLSKSNLILTAKYWKAKEDEKAYKATVRALAENKKNMMALYNHGVVGWYLEQKRAASDPPNSASGPPSHVGVGTSVVSLIGSPASETPPSWKKALEAFTAEEAEKKASIFPALAIETARGILAGKYAGRPEVIVFPKPNPAHYDRYLGLIEKFE